jgi:hypothetical protein
MSGAVLVLGVASEPPVARLVGELERRGAAYLMADQRELADGHWQTWIEGGIVSGAVTLGGETIPLDAFTGVYTRMASWATVLGPDHGVGIDPHVSTLHRHIECWLESTPIRVANRTTANDTNNSKPYQCMILHDYFDVPATLVTNDPQAVVDFQAEFGQVIYKSISGERSIVSEFDSTDVDRLDLLATVPVQFQEKLSGFDVRVHVVGTAVFATRIDSGATDYRYDGSGETKMTPFDLPDGLADACIAATGRLGLEISGIDLRFVEDGRVCCFEANPSPAYIVYEEETGQPISAALADRLLMIT